MSMNPPCQNCGGEDAEVVLDTACFQAYGLRVAEAVKAAILHPDAATWVKHHGNPATIATNLDLVALVKGVK